MKTLFSVAGCVTLMFGTFARAGLPDWVEPALKGDKAAIAQLREAGPPGLEVLMEHAKTMIDSLRGNRTPLDAPEAAGLRQVLDAVARQRDAYACGLYWYTDMEAAKAEAKRTGRLILSLRLLGHLDEEYSCANSRFFRTVLYANTEVSKELHDHYILHWKSVRPAPLITIDMGDGRRIKRTITGNSIHYVLNARGEVLDALPGLYGPKAFLASLERVQQAKTESVKKWLGMVAGPLSEEWLGNVIHGALPRFDKPETFLSNAEGRRLADMEWRRWHGSEEERLCEAWLQDAVNVGVYGFKPGRRLEKAKFRTLKECVFPRLEGAPIVSNVVDLLLDRARAAEASIPDSMARYVGEFMYPTEFDPSKGMVERPILNRIDANPPGGAPVQPVRRNTVMEPKPVAPADSRRLPLLVEVMTPALWKLVAGLHEEDTHLDVASQRFMMAKLPQDAISADERKTGVVTNEKTPFARTLRRFEQAVAEDTVRNEYLMHTQIHEWLETPEGTHLARDVEALNKKVYAELFLTPDYDEWLGLVPEDTYTALEKDGCACDKGAPPMRR